MSTVYTVDMLYTELLRPAWCTVCTVARPKDRNKTVKGPNSPTYMHAPPHRATYGRGRERRDAVYRNNERRAERRTIPRRARAPVRRDTEHIARHNAHGTAVYPSIIPKSVNSSKSIVMLKSSKSIGIRQNPTLSEPNPKVTFLNQKSETVNVLHTIPSISHPILVTNKEELEALDLRDGASEFS